MTSGEIKPQENTASQNGNILHQPSDSYHKNY